jgi:hypothetical protein
MEGRPRAAGLGDSSAAKHRIHDDPPLSGFVRGLFLALLVKGAKPNELISSLQVERILVENAFYSLPRCGKDRRKKKKQFTK